MVGDPLVQQADSVASSERGFARVFALQLGGRTGDIEVNPGGLADVTLQELGGGDRTRSAGDGVFHVGGFGI